MTEVQVNQPVLQTLSLRLSYGECDPAGIVYYAAYYPWFERTYSEWNYGQGISPDRMKELWGATHISVASGCEYKIPGLLHDPLEVGMRLRHMGTTSMSMQFDVDHQETGETYAMGHMSFVFVDDQYPPRPTPVPDGMKQVLLDAGCVF